MAPELEITVEGGGADTPAPAADTTTAFEAGVASAVAAQADEDAQEAAAVAADAEQTAELAAEVAFDARGAVDDLRAHVDAGFADMAAAIEALAFAPSALEDELMPEDVTEEKPKDDNDSDGEAAHPVEDKPKKKKFGSDWWYGDKR